MHAKAILTLIGGILIHFTLGTMYTTSNLTPYVISYLHVVKKHAVLFGMSNALRVAYRQCHVSLGVCPSVSRTGVPFSSL